MKEKIEIVEERIWLIKKLIDSKDHFTGREYIKTFERSWDHPYKHYSALRNYLILTCFDILGQPAEWLTFDSWLKSKKARKEREEIFSKYHGLDAIEVSIGVHSDYNKIYGVKNSFYKFLKEILSEANRKRLLDSIKVSHIYQDPVYHEDGSVTSGLSRPITVDEEEKYKLLYQIRNVFTHRGESISSGAAGIFENYDDFYTHIPNEPPGYLSQFLMIKVVNGEKWEFNSVGWPHILIDILKETLEELKKA